MKITINKTMLIVALFSSPLMADGITSGVSNTEMGNSAVDVKAKEIRTKLEMGYFISESDLVGNTEFKSIIANTKRKSNKVRYFAKSINLVNKQAGIRPEYYMTTTNTNSTGSCESGVCDLSIFGLEVDYKNNKVTNHHLLDVDSYITYLTTGYLAGSLYRTEKIVGIDSNGFSKRITKYVRAFSDKGAIKIKEKIEASTQLTETMIGKLSKDEKNELLSIEQTLVANRLEFESVPNQGFTRYELELKLDVGREINSDAGVVVLPSPFTNLSTNEKLWVVTSLKVFSPTYFAIVELGKDSYGKPILKQVANYQDTFASFSQLKALSSYEQEWFDRIRPKKLHKNYNLNGIFLSSDDKKHMLDKYNQYLDFEQTDVDIFPVDIIKKSPSSIFAHWAITTDSQCVGDVCEYLIFPYGFSTSYIYTGTKDELRHVKMLSNTLPSRQVTATENKPGDINKTLRILAKQDKELAIRLEKRAKEKAQFKREQQVIFNSLKVKSSDRKPATDIVNVSLTIEYNKIFNSYLKLVKVQSRSNHLGIKKVIVNQGNCNGLNEGRGRYLDFGEQIKVVTQCAPDSILSVDVITTKGTESFRMN